jgi:serine/threonine protein kinase
MEYVSGFNMKEINQISSIDVRERKRILMEIAVALNILHRKQIIHRDIKP